MPKPKGYRPRPSTDMKALWDSLTPLGQHHMLTGEEASATTMKALERRKLFEYRKDGWKKWFITPLGSRLRAYGRKIAKTWESHTPQKKSE